MKLCAFLLKISPTQNMHDSDKSTNTYTQTHTHYNTNAFLRENHNERDILTYYLQFYKYEMMKKKRYESN